MPAFIVTAIVGVICIVLGLSHRKGNISSLHSYHTKNVKEEDRIPFGKQVGLGTIIIGIGVILFSGFTAAAVLLDQQLLAVIGTAVMIAGLVLGCFFCFRAMIQYNNGIF